MTPELKRILENGIDVLDGISVDDLAADGLTVRQGNKILKFKVVSEETCTIEDEIREEVRRQIREKMENAKELLQITLEEADKMNEQIKQQTEEEITTLKRKLKKTKPMPEVCLSDAQNGISVVKDNMLDDGYYWLIRGVYKPMFYRQREDSDGDTVNRVKAIERKFAEKMESEIVFLFRTQGRKILDVSVRQPIGLQHFKHYHQFNSGRECFGEFNYPERFNSPDDLIKIARELEAVLEVINGNSIANKAPAGLPRRATVIQHLVDLNNRRAASKGKVSQYEKRHGFNTESGDVFTT